MPVKRYFRGGPGLIPDRMVSNIYRQAFGKGLSEIFAQAFFQKAWKAEV